MQADRGGCMKQRCNATYPLLWYAWRLGDEWSKGKTAPPFHFLNGFIYSLSFNCTVIWLKGSPGVSTVTLIYTGGAPAYNSEVSGSKEWGENRSSSWGITYFRKTDTSRSVRTVPLSLLLTLPIFFSCTKIEYLFITAGTNIFPVAS